MTHDLLALMQRWEDGALDQDETIELFQSIVNSGLAWRLQGAYGRMAADLLSNGFLTEPPRETVH